MRSSRRGRGGGGGQREIERKREHGRVDEAHKRAAPAGASGAACAPATPGESGAGRAFAAGARRLGGNRANGAACDAGVRQRRRAQGAAEASAVSVWGPSLIWGRH